MRVLITGSSGQIGSNLGLRLLADGHEVFGIDKRQNTWTNAFPTWLQDLAGHYPAFLGGIGGVEYPRVDLVVHMAAHAKVHQLVAHPQRALENVMMTFNVLQYARQVNKPVIFSEKPGLGTFTQEEWSRNHNCTFWTGNTVNGGILRFPPF